MHHARLLYCAIPRIVGAPGRAASGRDGARLQRFTIISGKFDIPRATIVPSSTIGRINFRQGRGGNIEKENRERERADGSSNSVARATYFVERSNVTVPTNARICIRCFDLEMWTEQKKRKKKNGNRHRGFLERFRKIVPTGIRQICSETKFGPIGFGKDGRLANVERYFVLDFVLFCAHSGS